MGRREDGGTSGGETTTTTKTNGNGANVFNMEHLRAAVDRHHRHISNEVERAWKERSKTLGGGFSFAGGAGVGVDAGAHGGVHVQGVRRAVQADAARAQGHRPRGEGGEAARASHRQEATCAAAEERRRIGGATEEVSLRLLILFTDRSELGSSPIIKETR